MASVELPCAPAAPGDPGPRVKCKVSSRGNDNLRKERRRVRDGSQAPLPRQGRGRAQRGCRSRGKRRITAISPSLRITRLRHGSFLFFSFPR